MTFLDYNLKQALTFLTNNQGGFKIKSKHIRKIFNNLHKNKLKNQSKPIKNFTLPNGKIESPSHQKLISKFLNKSISMIENPLLINSLNGLLLPFIINLKWNIISPTLKLNCSKKMMEKILNKGLEKSMLPMPDKRKLLKLKIFSQNTMKF